jgi:hypothetical protein
LLLWKINQQTPIAAWKTNDSTLLFEVRQKGKNACFYTELRQSYLVGVRGGTREPRELSM